MDGFTLYSFLLYLRHTDFQCKVVMNHQITILSDIHGDTTALEAVVRMRALRCNGILAFRNICLQGPGKRGPFELLDAIPECSSCSWREIGMIVSLEALDEVQGLEDQEIQLLRLTQYLMEGLDPKRIDWLRSFIGRKKEINGIRFH